EIANSIGIGLVVYFGLIQNLQNSGVDSQGAIIAFFFLMDLLFRPLRQIADKFNTLQLGMVTANRVFKILDTDSHIADQGSLVRDDVKGDLEFRDVRFGYVPGEEVLHGVSFSAKAGETVAIVG